jgi:hypothetical protein
VCRKGFHDEIWIASLENKMRKTGDNIVISDVRFPNEIKAIHNAGGMVIRVQRGENPDWFNDAADMNAGDRCLNYSLAKSRMQTAVHPDVSKLVWKFGRWHHHVNYTPFKKMKLLKKNGIEVQEGTNEYGMKLVKRA